MLSHILTENFPAKFWIFVALMTKLEPLEIHLYIYFLIIRHILLLKTSRIIQISVFNEIISSSLSLQDNQRYQSLFFKDFKFDTRISILKLSI